MGKLAVLSDLHVDINHIQTADLEVIASYLQEQQVTHLHLAGDIANKVSRALAVVDFFQEYLQVTFNWGNHEMADLKAHEIEVFQHPAFLNNAAISLNEKTVLVGYNGWYDYRFAENLSEEKIRQMKQLFWYDRMIPRTGSDPLLDHQLLQGLRPLLDQLREADKEVIFATHFVPRREFIVYQSRKEFMRWNQLNAFLGSAGLGELLAEYPNLRQVVFGHTHRRFPDLTLNGAVYSCRPLGYYYEWQLTREFVVENQLMARYNPGKLRGILKANQEAFDEYRRKYFLREVTQGITLIAY